MLYRGTITKINSNGGSILRNKRLLLITLISIMMFAMISTTVNAHTELHDSIPCQNHDYYVKSQQILPTLTHFDQLSMEPPKLTVTIVTTMGCRKCSFEYTFEQTVPR